MLQEGPSKSKSISLKLQDKGEAHTDKYQSCACISATVSCKTTRSEKAQGLNPYYRSQCRVEAEIKQISAIVHYIKEASLPADFCLVQNVSSDCSSVNSWDIYRKCLSVRGSVLSNNANPGHGSSFD